MLPSIFTAIDTITMRGGFLQILKVCFVPWLLIIHNGGFQGDDFKSDFLLFLFVNKIIVIGRRMYFYILKRQKWVNRMSAKHWHIKIWIEHMFKINKTDICNSFSLLPIQGIIDAWESYWDSFVPKQYIFTEVE